MKKPKRKKLVAWIVTCGTIPEARVIHAICLSHHEARAKRKWFCGYACRPHRIVKLVEVE